MRPVPARVSDLQRRLAAERDELAQVEGRIDGATEGPRLDLVATESQLAIVEARLDECAMAALVIDTRLVEARAAVAELERAAVRLANRIADASLDREAATRIIESLRAKVAVERARLAPVVERRQKEIDRLERRLATVLAYHPERRSECLTDPTPKAADAAVAQ